MSRCDYLDMMELLADRRTVCRVSIRDGYLSQMLDYIDEWKLQFGVMPTVPSVTNIYGEDTDINRHDDEYEVYLAKDLYDVRFALGAETDHDYKFLGMKYGYPQCCVDAFVDSWIGEGKRHDQYVHLSHALLYAMPGQQYQKIMTPDLENRTLSLFPCMFDCLAAVERAQWRADFMKRHHDWEPKPTSFGGVDFAS